ncbi:hypothetical protein [Nonomuraea rhodomycinica]|uniref:Excreted virulence factor EspC, type VII ESX diderm n=1 Tax=Nonomuraea rhodomycinica TaxID=1712872 RepID=A0A7Y6MCZ2_9ACTN|nr:hypothetical protein [Nonomuraea rhodomycinica]NUW43908.1 hypothetical protein [Nonomuraea rhodomycinica]
MVDVKTEALKTAARDFVETLLPIAEDVKVLAEGTTLSPYQWGAIGALTVARDYGPAREYQVKQAGDFVDCLNGTFAGLLSVVVHYRKVDLDAAEAAGQIDKVTDLRSRLRQDDADLAEARKKNQGLTD